MLPAKTLVVFALDREAKSFRARNPDIRIIVTGAGPSHATGAISKALAGVPHQLCHCHDLREAAKPIFEKAGFTVLAHCGGA